MSRQELFSQFFESLNNAEKINKIKITFKNGETLKITFSYSDEDNNNYADMLEAENMVQVDKDKNNYNNNNKTDEEFEDETIVDVDKDDCDGYIDDDDDN
ncbi:MAG: hypothetical protein PHZ11_06815 [Desulfitobacteriaceae bacterium]|nr:hypothetical protein [Desulfitobacteriaceae bacterium]